MSSDRNKVAPVQSQGVSAEFTIPTFIQHCEFNFRQVHLTELYQIWKAYEGEKSYW